MAINCERSTGKVTLSGTTATLVTLTGCVPGKRTFLTVQNMGVPDLHFTYAVNGNVATTAVAGAAETQVLAGGDTGRLPTGPTANGTVSVSVVGNGNAYCVSIEEAR